MLYQNASDVQSAEDIFLQPILTNNTEISGKFDSTIQKKITFSNQLKSEFLLRFEIETHTEQAIFPLGCVHVYGHAVLAQVRVRRTSCAFLLKKVPNSHPNSYQTDHFRDC